MTLDGDSAGAPPGSADSGVVTAGSIALGVWIALGLWLAARAVLLGRRWRARSAS
ncbi:MAG: hypothetical protein ACLP8X_19740 [Streptosporangiaceae bacterium]